MLEKKLVYYYQNELSYLRKYGRRFALHFPKIARRLGISEGASEDPHVERIIESFALLTAQIQQRLDEDMPEVTEALLQVLAPQFLRPWPSVCIVQMQPDIKTSGLTTASMIPAGMPLFSRTIEEHTCRFKTLYPVSLQPVTLEDAGLHYDTAAMQWQLAVHVQVWPGATLSGQSLRFYLNGSSMAVNILYTLLLSQVAAFSLSCGGQHFALSAEDIRAVGFEQGESVSGNDSRVSPVHTLLQDYFFFAQKFHFVDMTLPSALVADSHCPLVLTIQFRHCALIQKLEKIATTIDKTFFRLNCSPAVNLFSQRAEPIIPHHQSAEYPVIPDLRHRDTVSVWSVDRVTAMHKSGSETEARSIAPLFGLDHSMAHDESDIFWQCMQRETLTREGAATALFIAFSDRSERPLTPQSDLISLALTCFDGDVPARMKNGDPRGDFEAELPVAGVTIMALTRPGLSISQPVKQASRWRLISHLSLNHMLLSGNHGIQVLKETLALYNVSDNASQRQLINLIKLIDVTPVTARLIRNDPRSMARGIEIRITFDSAAAEELEYFLFCQFIEHFLALYAPVNSFSRVITCIDSREESTHQWPIRAGRLVWV